MIKDDIQLLFEYDRWANHRALQAASALKAEQFTRDLGGSFGSVRDTLSTSSVANGVGLRTGNRWLPAQRSWKICGINMTPCSFQMKFPAISEVKSKWAEVEKEQYRILKRPDGRILEKNASDSHDTNQPGEPDATSSKPFHLPSRASRTDDSAA